MDDIFEKIIRREIPAAIIYEDDLVLSFLDIRPINKGHALVVPKKKFVNIYDADPDVLAHMMRIAQKIALAHKEVTGSGGANIIMNNEKIGGQDVFHAHIHVVPRFERDGAFKPAQHIAYDEGEMERIAETLKTALQ